MLSNMLQFEKFYSSGASDEYTFENLAKQSGLFEDDDDDGVDMEMDSFNTSGVKFFDEDDTARPEFVLSEYETNQQTQQFSDIGSTNDHHMFTMPHSLPCGDEDRKINGPDLFPSSFEILMKYKSRFKRLNGENVCLRSDESMESKVNRVMSIETIIQLAAEKFIHTTSRTSNEVSVLSHPYPSSILCDSKEVQMVQDLLSCAEKVDEKKYERARKILVECERMSSPNGSPVERLVFYFTQALYDKIDRETGRIAPNGKAEDPLEALMKTSVETQIAFHKELPLSQITKFAGIQAVLDHLAEAKKVHFIDLEIRKGIQCTILMQALVNRCGNNPIEHLKISAVGKRSNKASLDETGRLLTSFAKSLDLNFSFNVVVVENIIDLDEKMFDLDSDEAVAVHAAYTLMHMIGQSDQLEHLMRVIRKLNFRVMVVSEVEANCNSPIFVDRFVEALVFFGACFESMAHCMKNDEKNRCSGEKTCFSSSIRNIVAAEGGERKIRHVSIGVWRAFFARFGFEETELSMSSVYQANLVLKNFISGNFYNFDVDGKSLIIKWKGTPVSSLSAWKLQCC